MKVKFTTTIDEDLVKQIKVQAIMQGVSVSSLLEKFIEEYMDETKRQSGKSAPKQGITK